MDSEGFAPNVILVDTNKDKKLSMMKQLALTLVKGLSSSPTAMIKKIAGLVCLHYASFHLIIYSFAASGYLATDRLL